MINTHVTTFIQAIPYLLPLVCPFVDIFQPHLHSPSTSDLLPVILVLPFLEFYITICALAPGFFLWHNVSYLPMLMSVPVVHVDYWVMFHCMVYTSGNNLGSLRVFILLKIVL